MLLPKEPWFRLYYTATRNGQTETDYISFENDGRVRRQGVVAVADDLFSGLQKLEYGPYPSKDGYVLEKGKLVKVEITVTETDVQH